MPARERKARVSTVESANGVSGTIAAMQKVLVTAGAAGIGREIVRAFAAAGARVCAMDIDADALIALREEIPAVATDVCDLGDLLSIEAVVPRAIGALGGLDVLVNNAGIAGPTTPIELFDPAEWERVMRVNLGGTFNVTRLAIPFLRKSHAGSIINMSSAAGKFGYPLRSAYATSKWGVIGFTKTLSMELGEFGIRANAILPGAVAGPRMDRVLEGRATASGRSLDEERAIALATRSIKTLTEASEIAALALFLASDAARTISGQAISVDGDMHRS
jgi:NAD(P)-dependent dehydrogenase (short-subunit alcohol dehydrogenase family)